MLHTLHRVCEETWRWSAKQTNNCIWAALFVLNNQMKLLYLGHSFQMVLRLNFRLRIWILKELMISVEDGFLGTSAAVAWVLGASRPPCHNAGIELGLSQGFWMVCSWASLPKNSANCILSGSSLYFKWLLQIWECKHRCLTKGHPSASRMLYLLLESIESLDCQFGWRGELYGSNGGRIFYRNLFSWKNWDSKWY